MDEQESQASEQKPRGQGIGRSLDRQRRRAEELLAAQKARLEQAESDLTLRLDSLLEVVAAEITSTPDAAGIEQSEQAEALRQRADELHRAELELAERERRLAEEQRAAAEQLRCQHEKLERGNAELERRQESIKRELEELNRRQSEIDAAAAKVRQTEIVLNSTNGEQAQQIEQLVNREARAAELEKRLAYEQDQLEMLREQTKTQRRRIAQELKAERASQQRELTRLRHDVEIYQAGQRQSLDQAAKQLQHERAELETELAAKRDEVRRQRVALDEKEAELTTVRRQLDAREQQLGQERTDEADRLRQEIEDLQKKWTVAQSAAGNTAGELAALQKAYEALQHETDTLRRSDETLEQAHNQLLQNHAALEKTLAALQQSHETLIEAKLKSDEALAQSNAALSERTSALAETNAVLAGKSAALAALEHSHEELRGQYDQQFKAYGDLRQAHEELAEAKAQSEKSLEESNASLGECTATLAASNAALAETNAALAGKSAALTALEQSHDELCSELDRQAESYGKLRQSHDELTQTHDKLQQSHGELKLSHDELTQSYFALTQSYDEVLESKRQVDGALADRASATVIDDGELQELRAEREALVARLAEAESKLDKTDSQQTDELQRRFELAVEDVRSLKRRNSELEEAVQALKAAGPRAAAAATSECANWETMKRNMIASLESDTDSTEQRGQERVTIENTIQITDDVVAGKDREIAEMKVLLSQQSDSIDSIAVGATAVAAIFDNDELILQERAKLAELQAEWKSKLRQAEIDISLERAKITRDRAEIEDKLAVYEKERSKQVADGSSPEEPAGSAKKPTRGRWLARLGLKDGD